MLRLLLVAILCWLGRAFGFGSGSTFARGMTCSSRSSSSSTRLLSSPAPNAEEKYTAVPGTFRPSIVDKARTITHVCTSGTLCTTSVMDEVQGSPFGSYVDYILDEQGWPVLLLSGQSLHTVNIRQSPLVSLFCQLPKTAGQTSAALSRVTVMGKIEPCEDRDELAPIKLAFTLVHPYSEQIVDSPKFSFFKIRPAKIYFSGGFGVMATWVDVDAYQKARPDVLAAEVPAMLSRVNMDKQGELLLLCRHFLGLEDVDMVRIQAIDRLGVDIRVQTGDLTDEYRVGFRHEVNSAEDAKSEVVKLFQESWERENGYFFTETLPPVSKYASDILRQ